MIGSSSITGPEKFQIGMEKRGKEFIFTSINYFLHMGLRFFVKSINGKPPLVFVDIWHHSQSYCDVTWHFSKPQPTECIITCIRYCPSIANKLLSHPNKFSLCLTIFIRTKNYLWHSDPLTGWERSILLDILFVILASRHFGLIHLRPEYVWGAKALLFYLFGMLL